MIGKQFTIEGFKEKLFDWALEQKAKYVPGEVYHMILLNEPDVAEFLKERGADASFLAAAIQKELSEKTISIDQYKNDRSMVVWEYETKKREVLLLEAPKEERGDLSRMIERNLYFQKHIRLAEKETKAMIDAEICAEASGRQEPTALEVFRSINLATEMQGPAIYKHVRLVNEFHMGGMHKKEFWNDMPTEEMTITEQEMAQKREAKLQEFTQNKPDADYSKEWLKEVLIKIGKKTKGP